MKGENTDLVLYLLRHGESVANAGRVFASRKIDPPLSDIGIRQATRQGESLKAIEFSAIYSSPLLRARQTAEIASQHCGLEVTICDALREVDVGILDGEYQDDALKWAIYEQVTGNWERGLSNVRFQEGESLDDVRTRLKGFLHGMKRKRRQILIVGHSLLFMAVIWLYCENRGSTLEDGHMGRGHLSIISETADRFRVLKFNISPDSLVRDSILSERCMIRLSRTL